MEMKIFQQCFFFIILVEMIKNEIFLLFYGTNNCLKCWGFISRVLGLFIGGSYHSLTERTKKNWEIKFYSKFFYFYLYGITKAQ